MKKILFIVTILIIMCCNKDVYANDELKPGIYYIHPKHAENKVIDVYKDGKENGEYIILYDKNNPATENQQFLVAKCPNSYYIIMPLSSGKVLDVKGGNNYELANIIQYELHGEDNQLWKIESEGNGYFSVHAKYDYNMCWDVYKASDLNETPLAIYPSNGGDNQKFKFKRVDKTIYGPQLKNSNKFERITKKNLDIKVSLKQECKHDVHTRVLLITDYAADMYTLVADECKKCGKVTNYVLWPIPNGDPL